MFPKDETAKSDSKKNNETVEDGVSEKSASKVDASDNSSEEPIKKENSSESTDSDPVANKSKSVIDEDSKKEPEEKLRQ